MPNFKSLKLGIKRSDFNNKRQVKNLIKSSPDFEKIAAKFIRPKL